MARNNTYCNATVSIQQHKATACRSHTLIVCRASSSTLLSMPVHTRQKPSKTWQPSQSWKKMESESRNQCFLFPPVLRFFYAVLLERFSEQHCSKFRLMWQVVTPEEGVVQCIRERFGTLSCSCSNVEFISSFIFVSNSPNGFSCDFTETRKDSSSSKTHMREDSNTDFAVQCTEASR